MSKRYLILTAILLACALGGFTWFVLRPQEPVYEGKPLRVWLEGYDDGVWGTPQRKMADEAVRHLGTNALPTLLRLLQAKDSILKIRLLRLVQKQHLIKVKYVPPDVRRREAISGIEALGAKAKGAVPVLVGLYEGPPLRARCAIAISLGAIGPDARIAVPSLLHSLEDPDLTVRRTAAAALGRIGAQPDLVVPALIKCLTNQESYFKQDVAYALEGFGEEAKMAVPALLGLLDHPDKNVRKDAVKALKRIAPETVAAVEGE